MLKKIKKYGIKGSIQLIYCYKLPNLYRKIFNFIFRNVELKNVIVFESLNDFDLNGGAIYKYMLESDLHEKYTMVWLTKETPPKNLPKNVYAFPFYGFSIKKEFYCNIAKYIFYDNFAIRKRKENQIVTYCGHATRAMKDCRGLVELPKDVDFIISASKNNDALMSEVYCADQKKFILMGMPVTDILINCNKELHTKCIIWMPTFRKSSQESWRNDTTCRSETGLPIIETNEELYELNRILACCNTKLIIKLHPAQDVTDIRIKNTENITILTSKDIKKMGVDTYELLAQTSALISDYSSISFDYLLLNRPIAYVLSDYNEYKLGFAVENPKEYMPGEHLYTFDDFVNFIKSVADGKDLYKKERNVLKDKIHTYQDGKSCKRILDFLGV